MPILNRYKVSVPDENGTGTIEYLQLVKVSPGSGLFSVTVPEHLRLVAKIVSPEQIFNDDDEYPTKVAGLAYHEIGTFEGEVVADSRDKALEQWKALMYRCKQFLTTQAKVKVILFNTEMNVSIYDTEGKLLFGRSDVTFAKTNPIVGVDYLVCFQAGKHLVDENNRYISKPEGSVVIPHTPERETFLENIVKTFEKAAVQLHDFVKVVNEDPLQIETFMKTGNLLEYNNIRG